MGEINPKLLFAVSLDSSLTYNFLSNISDTSQSKKFNINQPQIYIGRIDTGLWDTLVTLIERANYKQLYPSHLFYDVAPNEIIIYYGNKIKQIEYPEESDSLMGVVFNLIFQETKRIKLNSVFPTNLQYLRPAPPPPKELKGLIGHLKVTPPSSKIK